VINEVPVVARMETLESLMHIHGDLGIVGSLMAEIRLPDNERPIQVDCGPDDRLILWTGARQCTSYKSPWRLLDENDVKVIHR